MEPPRTPQCEKKASLAAYLGLDGGAAEKRRLLVKRKVRQRKVRQPAQSARVALEEGVLNRLLRGEGPLSQGP